MKNQFWVVLIGIVVGMVGLFLVINNDENGSSNNANTTNPLKIQLDDHAYSAGTLTVAQNAAGEAEPKDDKSKVTLIEYGDFECPACGQIFPIIDQLKQEFGSDLLFVFRHFPLTTLHPNATAAHRAAEAAGNQGKFFEMHDLLYERQSQWSSSTSGLNVAQATNVFEGYAQELELDIETYKSDVQSEEVFKVIDRQSDIGTSQGITGTPTFILNGERIETPRTYDQFRDLIQAELDAATDQAVNEEGEQSSDSPDSEGAETADGNNE